jgi:hypothetical protein
MPNHIGLKRVDTMFSDDVKVLGANTVDTLSHSVTRTGSLLKVTGTSVVRINHSMEFDFPTFCIQDPDLQHEFIEKRVNKHLFEILQDIIDGKPIIRTQG